MSLSLTVHESERLFACPHICLCVFVCLNLCVCRCFVSLTLCACVSEQSFVCVSLCALSFHSNLNRKKEKNIPKVWNDLVEKYSSEFSISQSADTEILNPQLRFFVENQIKRKATFLIQ